MDAFVGALFCPPGRHRVWEVTARGRRGRRVLALRMALVASPLHPRLRALCLLTPLLFV